MTNGQTQERAAAPRKLRQIVLTGGGSAGHVTPNLALLDPLRDAGWEAHYVGSYGGIERDLVARAGVPYHAVDTGKLRRYASWQNAVDPLRTLRGIGQAWRLLGRLRPDAVFSKGGFVAVPVVIGAWLRRIPIVVHESDRSPGLANRLSFPFAARICTAFADTLPQVRNAQRVVCTGSPIRPELLAGDRKRAERRFGIDPQRSLVLVFGGSLGARAINQVVAEYARELPEDLEILHVCGKGQLDPTLAGLPRYRAFEYMNDEFADALARADVVVARAGANSLAELLALSKPALLVPLPADASRGDQLENARVYAERGYGLVVQQNELTRATLDSALRRLLTDAHTFQTRMQKDRPADATRAIVAVLNDVANADP
ncbi:MAG: hypothetical protein RL701_2982 [Pseudomonadota bacterium]|jgi:UDP-N-acetylglucosamine--N-acetylmuramyl-(pentapeptide) pyrophosphoryl-undecaprenol N-acetylglucosamine transferase